MAQELSIKFKAQKEDILKYTQRYGKYKAMRKFGIKTIPAIDKLLMEWTNDKFFGVTPEIQFGIRQSVGDQLLDSIVSAMERYKETISNLQVRNKESREENQKLKEENDLLRAQLNQRYRDEDLQADIDRILKSCNEKIPV